MSAKPDITVRPVSQTEISNLSLPVTLDTVGLASFPYFVNAEYLSEMQELGIAVPDSLGTAILKRKVEFAAGRFCAKSALRQLGYWGDAVLAIGSDRAPIWPPGYAGSISHGYGLAIAAVARREGWSGIGIDIERLLEKDAAQPILAQLARSAELNLGIVAGLTLENWATLIFSAKESLFKALYPKVGRYFDFLDAEVCELREEDACIILRLITTLSPHCIKGAEYRIRYAYFDGFVATFCLLPLRVDQA